MNESHSFTLQDIYLYYKVNKIKNVPLSWNKAADLFIFEKQVIEEDIKKVINAFKILDSRMQRCKKF